MQETPFSLKKIILFQKTIMSLTQVCEFSIRSISLTPLLSRIFADVTHIPRS